MNGPKIKQSSVCSPQHTDETKNIDYNQIIIKSIQSSGFSLIIVVQKPQSSTEAPHWDPFESPDIVNLKWSSHQMQFFPLLLNS